MDLRKIDFKTRAKQYLANFPTKEDAIKRINITLKSFEGKNIEHNENLKLSFNWVTETKKQLEQI